MDPELQLPVSRQCVNVLCYKHYSQITTESTSQGDADQLNETMWTRSDPHGEHFIRERVKFLHIDKPKIDICLIIKFLLSFLLSTLQPIGLDGKKLLNEAQRTHKLRLSHILPQFHFSVLGFRSSYFG